MISLSDGGCGCDHFTQPRETVGEFAKNQAASALRAGALLSQVIAVGFPARDPTQHRGLHALALRGIDAGPDVSHSKLLLSFSSFPALRGGLPPDDGVVCCSPIHRASQSHSVLLIVLLGLLPFSLENSDSSSDEPRPCGGFPDPPWQRPSLPSSSGCPHTHLVG